MSSKEQPLPHLERAAVANEAAAVLRHDLRNKFASIRNAAFYLRRRLSKTEPFEADPRVALFFKLIDDELVLAEGMLSERGRLGHLFGASTAPTRLEEAVLAALAAAAPPPEIRVASPIELVLLIRSLVDNAIEAMPDGGTLVVRTADVDGAAVLEVADSGTGMDDAARLRAFEPFVSAKAGHAGIGLNVARRIAERYSGRIDLQSPGSGALVRVTWPCAAEAL